MTIVIDNEQGLEREFSEHIGLECPYCGVYAHMSPQSVPTAASLLRDKPSQVGLVFKCNACDAPVFLRFAVRDYKDDRVELNRNFIELERPKERFAFSYLPKHTEVLFREALSCYSSNNFNAFASMCRRATVSAYEALGEGFHGLAVHRAALFDVLYEVVQDRNIEICTGIDVASVVEDGPARVTPTCLRIDQKHIDAIPVRTSWNPSRDHSWLHLDATAIGMSSESHGLASNRFRTHGRSAGKDQRNACWLFRCGKVTNGVDRRDRHNDGIDRLIGFHIRCSVDDVSVGDESSVDDDATPPGHTPACARRHAERRLLGKGLQCNGRQHRLRGRGTRSGELGDHSEHHETYSKDCSNKANRECARWYGPLHTERR